MRWALLAAVAAAFAPAAAQTPALNTLTPAEQQDGWRLLFDGTSLRFWRAYKQNAPSASWAVVDGAIERARGGPDLITVEQFADFDFRFEWMVTPGANSGIMYYVTEEGAATYDTGPEYQILDNARHADGKNPLTSAGACYALYAPSKDTTRPVGSWNEGRIVIQKGRGEHWLNGVKVVEFELGSPDWNARVAASKFGIVPTFGKARRGHLAIQEHGARVAFRNLKIKASPGS
jgi:hypothetical protein